MGGSLAMPTKRAVMMKEFKAWALVGCTTREVYAIHLTRRALKAWWPECLSAKAEFRIARVLVTEVVAK